MKFGSKSVIQHLVSRLSDTSIPVILAVPPGEVDRYKEDLGSSVLYYEGNESDPLARMSAAANFYGIENVIRVTHDKIFVDPEDVLEILDCYYSKNLDYIYSSSFIPGTGFEIISTKVLNQATEKFKDVEFIGYSVRSLTNKVLDYPIEQGGKGMRLLLDYEQDVTLFNLLFAVLGDNASLPDVVKYINSRPWINDINKIPEVTIYTCVYNGHAYIQRAMNSVASQVGFKSFEYIIIDDCSTDNTIESVSRFCTVHNNSRWIRNDKNLGLAASSNIALSRARGEYIMRIDADDYFSSPGSVIKMLSEIKNTKLDVIYPDFYFGKSDLVGSGDENHHIGGALFNTRSINYLKFTNGLRGYDGLDVFLRAKNQLRMGYLREPIFVYTQRNDSMSKTNLTERAEIRKMLENMVHPL
jgi:spore coat polysaccharide biosynthesis protein SpsF (cytidylyltransferase family)